MMQAMFACSLLGLLISWLFLIPDSLLGVIESYEPRVLFRGSQHKKGKDGKPMIALTIDDAPYLGNKHRPRKQGESQMSEILDVLKEHNAKATFMIMSHEDGQKWYADVVKRAVDEGHELGNHGTIDEAAAALSPEAFQKKFDHCDRLLRALQGEKTQKWFRPGSGAWNKPMLQVATQAGYRTVLTNDYQLFEPFTSTHSAFSSFTAFYLRMRARPGAIMLVHDRIFTPVVLQLALPEISRHFDIVTLSELFE
jgi:peptidoglycan/xylan/chitin deacetylase (PgdA/CDA1 family)